MEVKIPREHEFRWSIQYLSSSLPINLTISILGYTLNIAREARVLERIFGKQHGEATLKRLREAAATSIGIPKAGSEIVATRLILESWLKLLAVLEQQLEKYAGYNLRQFQSGEFVGRRHISRIGNRRLSWIVYKMTEEAARYLPEVRLKYLKCQLHRRQYRNNLVACVPVLLKLIVSLIKENRLYQESTEKLAELSELEVRYEQVTGKKSKRAVVLNPAA